MASLWNPLESWVTSNICLTPILSVLLRQRDEEGNREDEHEEAGIGDYLSHGMAVQQYVDTLLACTLSGV
jgi:hypothetical protein